MTEISKLDMIDATGLSMALMNNGYEDISFKRKNGQVFLKFAKIQPVFINHEIEEA